MRCATVRRGLLAAGFAVLGSLAACAHAPQQLYAWGTFPRQQYETLLGEGASPEQQIQALEAHAQKTSGGKSALPPGFRAHLGLLYNDVGNTDKARSLWLAEKAAFPESAPYMDQLLKRLDAPATTTDKQGGPA